MTDTANTPAADQPQPIPSRYPDGSDPDHNADLEELEEQFASLRRLTF